MKRIAVPMTFVIFLSIVFVLGLSTQSLWLLTPSFCLWTPGIFWLGYAIAKAGISVQVTSSQEAAANPKQHRQQQKAGQAYQ